jgi:hypothetical protein
MDDGRPVRAAKGTGSWARPAVLIAAGGVELVRHADGSREVRRADGPMESMSSAFDALATLGFWGS